jgi:hypothetical protein
MKRLNPLGHPEYIKTGFNKDQRKIETARKNAKIKLLDALDELTDYAEMATEQMRDRKIIERAYDLLIDFIIKNV